MKKKAVAILLSAAMALSLVACGESARKNETGQISDASASAQSESTEASDSTEAVPEETINYYGFDEQVDIKIGVSYASAADFTFYGGETVENNAWMDLYHENNIFPEILYEVDPSQADTKLSTAIMSGDYPDVFTSTGAEYQNYVDSEVAADITEAYEKYASDELKEYMTGYDDGMALESLYIDGKLYGLPKVSDAKASAHVMWIRQDWLDNLGLEIPTTMEELKEVAHAFTYDDPDGNGKDDTYGLVLDGINVLSSSVGNTEPVFEAFGAYLGTNGLTYIEQDGEIVWGGADTEAMKAALSWLQEVYSDGSLAKDFITMDSESVFNETGAGNCGIWFGPNWGAMQPSAGATQNDINCHMVAAAVPLGTGSATKAYAASSAGTIYCVSSQCENPEVLIKLFNLSVKYQNADLCTAEEYKMYFGDSVNFTGWKTSIIGGEAPNGRSTNKAILAALESGDDSTLTSKQLENYTAIKTYIDAVADGTFDPTDPTHQRGLALYTVHADEKSAWSVLHKMIADDDYVLAAYNGIPSDTVSSESATLQKLLVETIVKIVTKAQDVDSYDSFVDTWYAMGGQDAMDEANAAK